jgi:hypothetical protein
VDVKWSQLVNSHWFAWVLWDPRIVLRVSESVGQLQFQSKSRMLWCYLCDILQPLGNLLRSSSQHWVIKAYVQGWMSDSLSTIPKPSSLRNFPQSVDLPVYSYNQEGNLVSSMVMSYGSRESSRLALYTVTERDHVSYTQNCNLPCNKVLALIQKALISFQSVTGHIHKSNSSLRGQAWDFAEFILTQLEYEKVWT